MCRQIAVEPQEPLHQAVLAAADICRGISSALASALLVVSSSGCTKQAHTFPDPPASRLVLTGQPATVECVVVRGTQQVTVSMDLFMVDGPGSVTILSIRPVNLQGASVVSDSVLPLPPHLASPSSLGLGVSSAYPPTDDPANPMTAALWSRRLAVGSELPGRGAQYAVVAAARLDRATSEGHYDGLEVRYRARSADAVVRTATSVHLTSGHC